MIKEAEFPKIKTVDLAMHPKVIDSRLMKKDMNFAKGKIDYTKAKIEKVVTKPKKEVNVGTMPKKDVGFELKKAGYPGKIKVVKDIYKGSLEY